MMKKMVTGEDLYRALQQLEDVSVQCPSMSDIERAVEFLQDQSVPSPSPKKVMSTRNGKPLRYFSV